MSGDVAEVFSQLRSQYDNIWMAGGAMLAKELVQKGLADEIRLSILPIILGDGHPFLDHVGTEQELILKDVTAFHTGLVELWYEIKRP